MSEGVELLTLKDVTAIAKVDRSTVYEWMKNRGFPKPLKMSPKAVRWRADEVTAWFTALPRGA